MRWSLLTGVVTVACTAANPPPQPEARGTTVYLSPTEHLVRASMALRGLRPSIDDLRAVAADPGALPAIVDRYVQSPEFGDTVRELHNEVLLLRTQRFDLTTPAIFPLQDLSFDELAGTINDEPLRLIEDVVMTDQPYTHIVTSPYTMADATTAIAWGLPHSSNPGWERTAWTDGRPLAGILSSSALYVRWRSAADNFNRGRANQIARALLCHDFLAGDVKLDTSVDLSNPAIVANAVVANPSCAACHQTLDPLASYFFGFAQGVPNPQLIGAYPYDGYYEPATPTWLFTNGRPPGYFGQNPQGLDGLGQAIAADPRFAQCAAQNFASYLTEVGKSDLPAPWIAQLQDGFTRSGYKAKELAKQIVLSDQFRVSHDDDLARAESVVGLQKARPAQLSRMLYDLTGYHWTGVSTDTLMSWKIGPIDYLDDDYSGFRVLAGGIDSFYITEPVHTVTTTSSMVSRLVAQQAAEYVVDHDTFAPIAGRRLFTAADVTSSDEPTVRAELEYLHARIYGELDADVDDTYALYSATFAASGSARRAWIVTLTGMLSDLRAIYY